MRGSVCEQVRDPERRRDVDRLRNVITVDKPDECGGVLARVHECETVSLVALKHKPAAIGVRALDLAILRNS